MTQQGPADVGIVVGPHVEDLPALAQSEPDEAMTRATQVLSGRPDDTAAGFAHQAIGLVLRDRGDLANSLGHLRSALRSAGRAGDPERVTDVRATLGATLVMAGRTAAGLAELDTAVAQARGPLMAKVRLRRAYVLVLLGRPEEALLDLRRALAVARRAGDVLSEARILHNRSFTYLCAGRVGPAEADVATAERLYDALGQRLESARAGHNRASVAFVRGDIPTALRLLDVAEARYVELKISQPELLTDRSRALLAAGLASEAVDSVRIALTAGALQPVQRSELLFAAAGAALAAGQPQAAREWATSAASLFARQQRPSWRTRARLLACEARYLDGERSTRLSNAVHGLAASRAELPDEEQARAHLLAARIDRERGRPDSANSQLTVAARFRNRGSALTRSTGWLALALLADGADTDRGLLAACGRGLDTLDEHRLLFGAAEIRAVATWHARDLTELAIATAVRRRSARLMLEWTERSRATSLAEPSVRPVDDAGLQRDLAAVRDSVRRLQEGGGPSSSNPAAEQQRDAGEAAVRRRRRQLHSGSGTVQRFDVDKLRAASHTSRIVELVESGGVLWAVDVCNGRMRRYEIGPVADVVREVEFTRFALRRAAHARGARVSAAAARLQRAALGPLATRLADGPVVLVPPARLHALPWALLPALRDLPVSVAPSAAMWLRAAAARPMPEAARTVLLVGGPDLEHAGAEVGRLERLHPAATVLGRAAGAPEATTERVLLAMSGAQVAHIAAHGTFRADSPLFSWLQLDDGPMFVHDLDRLDRPPHNVVLSSCDSGVGAPVGADELLGLVSGLLRVGAVSVLASVVPVNDERAVPFMEAVHLALAAGQPLPEAARRGRAATVHDPELAATAGSFTAWGA